MGLALTAGTPVLLVAGVLVAGWFTIWAIYAWEAHDATWIVAYGALTLLALVLPAALLVLHGRREAERGPLSPAARRATKALDWACGVFALLLGLLAAPFVVVSGYFAWMFGSDGVLGASVYFACVALALLGEPVVFLVHYDRWRTRNGLGNRHVSA